MQSSPVHGVLLDAGCGRFFITHDRARIIRLYMPFSPTDDWTAFAIYTARGRRVWRWTGFVEHLRMVGKEVAPLVFRYKNGKPRYRLGDIDHGTVRVWGDGILDAKLATMRQKPDHTWEFV